MYSVGVDIGGTFTDVVVLDEEGNLRTYKTSSTPADLGEGVVEGLRLAASGLDLTLEQLLSDTAYFGHGTTAATNAFIERKGSKTGLITTRGFGDTLLIQRMLGMTAGLREEQMSRYSLRAYPDPIIPPEMIFEVTERVDYKGAEIVPVQEEDVRHAAHALANAGVRTVAVCLLWSFKNPAHERRVRVDDTEGDRRVSERPRRSKSACRATSFPSSASTNGRRRRPSTPISVPSSGRISAGFKRGFKTRG